MARIITKEHARKIVKKLKAKLAKRSRVHVLYDVIHEGRVISTISVRHSSQKDSGHDHIPGELQISPSKSKRLAQCSITRQQWIDDLQARKLL